MVETALSTIGNVNPHLLHVHPVNCGENSKVKAEIQTICPISCFPLEYSHQL